MKLVSYRSAEGLRPGVVYGTNVYDVQSLLARSASRSGAPASTMRELLCSFGDDLPGLDAELKALAGSYPQDVVGDLDEVDLGPAVPDPAKFFCVGLNYKTHVLETGRELPAFPDIFVKFHSSLIGPYDDIALSQVTDKLDYEGELAVVIGRAGRNIPADRGMDHVAGAMVVNDTTARDLQFNGTQWTPGKAVDASTPCGPTLVSLDALSNLESLSLTTWVNGEEVQHDTTDMLIFPVGEIVSYVSRFVELQPGDVISTGTPEGIGSRRNPPRFLRPGDVVEVQISELGRLRNTVR
jgi:acylpyruvate hydrolase